VSDESAFLLIMPTPLGAIALSMDELREARSAAEKILDDAISAQNQDEAADATTLLDAQAIADLYSMDPSWFLTRARDNRMPHVRIGKYVRFDPEEIRHFFHQNPDRHEDL
jgi:predicted DNA-binding transcriptional regulator AlpA